MSTDETTASASREFDDRLAAFLRTETARTAAAVLAVTALALSIRLFALGSRVFHWDEGRVGYWILRYAETGVWEYHAVIHGPFFYHVNKYLFLLFGPSDFLARLPVAVVSGLLPLTAWLFRERLDRVEMVAVGLFFALNPVVLYYSRFMRNDVLLAAFMIHALAFYVRLFDTRKPRYLYLGTLMVALAFTTKENVLVYVVTWIGAAVLLFDHRLQVVTGADDRRAYLRERVRRARAEVGRWGVHALLATALFFAVVIFFYAPRARGVPGPGLWKAFSNPGMFPAVVGEATLGSWEEFVGKWGEGNASPYTETFKALGVVLWDGALAVLALAGVGFLADRYAGDRPRDLVAFAFYWGFVSVLGYPVIVENAFPWEVVHAVVPLAIPAGVGLAVLVRWGVEAVADRDGVSAALVALLVVLLVGQAAFTAVSASFVHPEDRYRDANGEQQNYLVQYGQPAEGLRPTLETMRDAITRNDGTDVVYYGYVTADDNYVFYVPNESENDDWAAGGGWYDRLPLPWYTEMYGAEVNSTNRTEELGRWVRDERPPIVIARAQHRDEVGRHLDGYRATERELTIYGSETVFFVDERYLESRGGANG